jgi:hypothetical protein
MNLARPRSSFRPQLETLEQRWCPACDVRLAGSALFITGDAGDNNIAIFDNGADALEVFCDDDAYLFDRSIHLLVVRGGDGDDTIDAIIDTLALDAPRAWLLDAGAGNDLVFPQISGILDVPVSVAVQAGDGDDSVSAFLAADVNSLCVLNIDGGNGNDSLYNFGTSVRVNGVMIVNVDGRGGDDMIDDAYLDMRVNGVFVGSVNGGDGADQTFSNLGSLLFFDDETAVVEGFDVAPGAHAHYSVSGGKGQDTLFVNYLGTLDGRLGIRVDAGQDNDAVFASLGVHETSTGSLSALIHGGNGDDQLEVSVLFLHTEPVEFFGLLYDRLVGSTDDPAPLLRVSVTANGGAGFDTCLHSLLVDVLNVEDDQPF